jgi:uncharacterized membrane protein
MKRYTVSNLDGFYKTIKVKESTNEIRLLTLFLMKPVVKFTQTNIRIY